MVPVGFESFISSPITYYVHKNSYKTNNRAEHLCETLKGPTRGTFQKRTLYLEIGLSIFEIRTNFSLALKKVGSYTRGFAVLPVSESFTTGLKMLFRFDSNSA